MFCIYFFCVSASETIWVSKVVISSSFYCLHQNGTWSLEIITCVYVDVKISFELIAIIQKLPSPVNQNIQTIDIWHECENQFSTIWLVLEGKKQKLFIQFEGCMLTILTVQDIQKNLAHCDRYISILFASIGCIEM